MTVRIHSKVLEEIIEHARRVCPLECCGLLSGSAETIDEARPTPNQWDSPTRFSVPSQELFAFFKELRQTGRRHLGVYHSHPRSEGLPSARDEAEFHYPEVSYWIISLQGDEPDVSCFQWRRKAFEKVPFQVILGPDEKVRDSVK